MKFEFSAGGVVYKKDNGNIFILMVQHGGYAHHWGFPKGHIADTIKGETKEDAALREVKEETGIDAKLLQALAPIQFWYVRDEEKRKKTVYFFVMEYQGGDFSQKDLEMQDVQWIPIKDVLEKVTFKSEKQVFQEAKKYLQTLK
jgi:8-oxo-dGTP diphosphatase